MSTQPTTSGRTPRHRAVRAFAAAALVLVFVVAGAAVVSVLDDGDPNAGTASTTSTVEPLVADFEWDYDLTQTQGTACGFGTTYLFDRSSGEPTSWRWEFPDGSTSTEQNPIVESGRTVFTRDDGTIIREVILTVSRDGQRETVGRQVFPTHC